MTCTPEKFERVTVLERILIAAWNPWASGEWVTEPRGQPSLAIVVKTHVPSKSDRMESSAQAIRSEYALSEFEQHFPLVPGQQSSHVSVATDERSKQLVVVKFPAAHVDIRAFLHEAEVMKACVHDNVVDVIGVIEDSSNNNLPAIVTAFAPGNSLRNAMPVMNNTQKLSVAVSIARGLAHIHSRGVAHLCLKPENVLLDESRMVGRLVDFGSRELAQNNRQGARCIRPLEGTYAAPERPAYPELASDVWSLGAIIFEMFTEPISQLAFGRIMRGGSIDCSVVPVLELRKICAECLHSVADERPTAIAVRGRLERKLEDATVDDELRRLRAEVAEMLSERRELDRVVQDLRESLQRSEASVAKLTRANVGNSAQLAGLSEELHAVRCSLETEQKAVANLRDRLRALEAVRSELLLENSELSQRLSVLVEPLGRFRADWEKERKRADEFSKKFETAEEKAEEMERRHTEVCRRLAGVEGELSAVQRELEAERASNADLRVRLAEAETAGREAILKNQQLESGIPTNLVESSGVVSWRQGQLARMIDAGNVEAKVALADLPMVDPLRSFRLYREAAESGESRAFGRLGHCYEFGLGTGRDRLKAAEWYSRGAEAGDTFAKVRRARLVQLGDAERFETFRVMAEAGNAEAALELSRCYGMGVGTSPDVTKSAYWMTSATRLGTAETSPQSLGLASSLTSFFERRAAMMVPTISIVNLFQELGILGVPKDLVERGWIRAVGSLLFEGSRDFQALAFHSACDRKGPTLVVVQCRNGSIFGGVSTMDWTSQGGWNCDIGTGIFVFVWKSRVVPTPTEFGVWSVTPR